VTSVRCLVTVGGQLLACEDAHPSVNVWPGGRREPHESWAQTARREVSEETGWLVQPESLTMLGFLHYRHLTPVPAHHPYPSPDFLQVVMHGDAVGGSEGWVDTEGHVLAPGSPISRTRRPSLSPRQSNTPSASSRDHTEADRDRQNGDMADAGNAKAVLHHYLRRTRDDLIWKLDGLGERDARLPRTQTGNNMLGVIKHCLNVEAGYFGPTFGREFPTPEELVPMELYDQDPQADWYAREDEPKEGLISLYGRVGSFADQTIEQLPLDAPGRVPWWRPGRQDVTLQQIIVHVLYDLARHAGHVDIMRETYDGAIGWQRENTNVPDEYDWPAYVAKLTDIADRFAPHGAT
jgi:uncharacterized damage-inducible protein DinB